jgi:hypothetical protein
MRFLTFIFCAFICFSPLNIEASKAELPFGLTASLLNDPSVDGEAMIEVTARSERADSFTLKCDYGALTLVEGEAAVSFSIDADGTKKFIYRFSLPDRSKQYTVRLSLKSSKGMTARVTIEINKPILEQQKIKRLPSGQGIRELGP